MSRLALASIAISCCAFVVFSPGSAAARPPELTDAAELLARPVTLSCHAAPLVRALRQLREQTGATIVFDAALLEREGILPTAPVSITCSETRLDRALDLLLEPCSLAYEMRDGAIWVLPDEDRYATLQARDYPISDLRWKPPGTEATEYEEIQGLLFATCSPASWERVGGRGRFAEQDDVLRILQSPHVHAAVADTFAEVRRVRAARPGHEMLAGRGAAVRRRMSERVSWSFEQLPLGQFAARLSALADCSVVVECQAVKNADVALDVALSGRAANQPLGRALTECLREAYLAWVERDGALFITSHDEAESDLTTQFYNVRDLARREGGGHGTTRRYDELLGLITSRIVAQSWDEFGGPGSAYDFDGLLCISQSTKNHAAIVELLTLLRRFERRENERVETLGEERLVEESEYLGNQFDDTLVTRFYDLRDLARLPGRSRVTPAGARQVLVQAIAPESWDEFGGAGSVQDYRGVLVVSQTWAVHRRIERLFEQLRERRGW